MDCVLFMSHLGYRLLQKSFKEESVSKNELKERDKLIYSVFLSIEKRLACPFRLWFESAILWSFHDFPHSVLLLVKVSECRLGTLSASQAQQHTWLRNTSSEEREWGSNEILRIFIIGLPLNRKQKKCQIGLIYNFTFTKQFQHKATYQEGWMWQSGATSIYIWKILMLDLRVSWRCLIAGQ